MAGPHEDEEVVEFSVALDLKTVAWLMQVCEGAHAPPSAVLSAMIRDIREDDEIAHDIEQTQGTPEGATLN